TPNPDFNQAHGVRLHGVIRNPFHISLAKEKIWPKRSQSSRSCNCGGKNTRPIQRLENLLECKVSGAPRLARAIRGPLSRNQKGVWGRLPSHRSHAFLFPARHGTLGAEMGSWLFSTQSSNPFSFTCFWRNGCPETAVL